MSAELSAIILQIEELPPLQGWTGHRTQAWLLRWIQRSAPEVAARLHNTNARKPYTISPLVWENETCLLRVTTLDPALAPLLIDPIPFEHSDKSYAAREIRRESASFSEILRAGESTEILPDLHCWTPTAFRSMKMEINLPLPELVFGSLIHAWDSFSPLLLPMQLRRIAAESITITRHSLHTRRIMFPHRGEEGKRTGFIGRVRFGGSAGLDPVALRFFSVLLRLAPYAGLGIGTAAGMGQVRLLQGWHDVLSLLV